MQRNLGQWIRLPIYMQAAGPDSALITGETVRLRFSVKGYDASESWDIYWTGRQVSPQFYCATE